MLSTGQRVSASTLAGVACISAAILLVELGITRLFSVIAWYHFAFLAVSVALFGMSASGVFVHLAGRRHPPERVCGQMAGYGLIFAIVTVAVALLLLRTRVGSAISSENLWEVTGLYLLLAAPFFVGGACLTLAVSRLYGDINRVYAFDLVGAAAGCLLFIPTVNVFGGGGPLLGAAALAAVSACLFSARGSRLARAAPALLFVGIAGMLGVQLIHPYLDIRYTKAGERAVVFTKWNSHSRIAVYPRTHAPWGLSEKYTRPPPDALYLDIDASASTPILLAQSLEEVEYLRADITSLGYRLLPRGSETLVIGPGGGRDLWTGLVHGASRVTGVEINSIIVDDVMSDVFREASGDIYHRPGVEVVHGDGRHFLSRSRQQYDLIQASLVDTWAASAAGAFTLTEHNLHTVEAFVDYLQHLKPDGILTISRWTDHSLVRLISLARAASEQLGWDGIADRLFIAGQGRRKDGHGNLSTIVIKRSPLSESDVRVLTEAATELDFEVQYTPALAGRPAQGDPAFIETAIAANPAPHHGGYAVDISPVTDDRPFFFFGKLDIAYLLHLALFSPVPPQGAAVLVRLLCISIFLIAAFVLIPLAVGTRFASGVRRVLPVGGLAYFACLGVGFMLVEVGLMQRFVLFLGHPVYSLTVVLFSLLVGGGIGSALGRRFSSPERALVSGVIFSILIGTGYAYGLPSLFSACLGWGHLLRVLTAIALLLPLGIVLGMPLPAGVALLSRTRPEVLAWAWAINGATSVLGSILAVLLALILGFQTVALTGVGAYCIALALGLRLAGRSAPAELVRSAT